ncbi:sulfur carrier protein ThiS [Leptospirillum ferriphilum]|uniref:Thiamine biosynthesis protein ThiS n=3 Tax=Leptospirillum ferriphilum TaxID=178606 RepID=A0A059XTC5_9BACT|nr:sulfur carrier protein ThiS [Leptospirillum ferriphilum]AFS53203.1 sulfur transfer protein involved in thiamine biosynthesis [Leptospirillum ferriphilum ML-04]AIA30280.1 thiamine biosynthesis protein ThiS [Leptospirillum ferriphilum YSK]OOH75192.1 thiamine biosynthesis protein ThiS [Leptospirillum ferriphilum]OOH78818.1 thiamine biosynthesis protein ThiS [Leptospirillum ferriphilum]
MFVRVFLNGESQELPAPATIQTAVEHLGLSDRHLVAELNLEIFPRDAWGKKNLSDGDHLEFIGFVGGGTS